MTNHSSRRDRRRFLQESMFATVALAGGMDARPSALALGVTPQYRIYSIAGYNIAHIDVTARLCEEHNIRYQDVDRVDDRELAGDAVSEPGVARRIRGVIPGLPIPAPQFERLIATCRDLDRERAAATLVELTLKP
jgi:hypothetical protein